MPAPQIKLFTAADYRATPDDGKRCQVIEGELILTPTPSTHHQLVMGENAAKPVALSDEPETFASPLFPGLKLRTAEIFRR